MQSKSQYTCSFTAGGLLYHETINVLELLINEGAEENLFKEAFENKFIKIRSESARKRSLQEIRLRARFTDHNFWIKFSDMSKREQQLILFFLSLKTYRLIFDFHFNITLPGWKTTGHIPDHFSYLMKLDEIASHDAEVNSWTESSRLKSVTVYKRMMNEAGLLQKDKLVYPDVSDQFWCFFFSKNEDWFPEACFLSMARRNELKELCK